MARYARQIEDDEDETTYSEEVQVQQEEPPAQNPEEESFKKRYGDLRRHMQQKESYWQSELEKMKEQLDSATRQQIKFPKTDEEIEQWTKKYPDVAAIIDTIARKRASELLSEGEKRLEKVEKMREDLIRKEAEQELLRLHPDFAEIRTDPAFHEWAKDQSRFVQDALYRNNTDAKAAAEAIDLYKYHKGIAARKKGADKGAAAAVTARGGTPATTGKKKFSESQVAKMSSAEYEKNEDAIFEAMRKGEFVYDISGGAR